MKNRHLLSEWYGKPLDIVCIGSPHLIGDCVGPLLGSMLQDNGVRYGVKVMGTLKNPVTISTIDKYRAQLRKEALVVAVDATIGCSGPIIHLKKAPLHPGAALGKRLEPIGDYSIHCRTAQAPSELQYCNIADVYSIAREVYISIINLLSY